MYSKNSYSNGNDYWKLEIYDSDGNRLKAFERDGWEPKSGALFETSDALIPVHYHETIPFINITFAISEGEED